MQRDKSSNTNLGDSDIKSNQSITKLYYSTNKDSNMKIAEKQLLLLGYSHEDKIYLRFFYGKDDPRKENDLGIKKEYVIKSINWKLVKEYNKDRRGVYFVVNGQGHKDEDVKEGRAVFIEHDDLPIEDQINLWQKLELPEPTLQINTGGNSIHSYWVFEKPVTIKEWQELQKDLLNYADADQSIKNPSRVMRLAGFNHQKGNPVTFVSESGKKYNYTEIRNKIPKTKANQQGELFMNGWERFLKDFSLPINNLVNLIDCLCKETQNLIDLGATEGGRNTSGFKVASDLIGTANYLNSIGQKFDGDPSIVFSDFCHRCTPPLSDKEGEAIYKSAMGSNPTPSCGEEGIRNIIAGLVWNQNKLEKPTNGKGFNKKQPKTLDFDQIWEECVRIYWNERGTRSEEREFIKLANKSGWDLKEIRGLYYKVAEDLDKENTKENSLGIINELIRLQNQKLDLSEIFPELLADSLEKIAKNLGVDSHRFIGICFAGLSTLLGAKIFVKGKRHAIWNEFLRIYYADIAPPSGKKTQVQNRGLAWLKNRQIDKNIDYLNNLDKLKKLKQAWTVKPNDEKNELIETEENPEVFEANQCNLHQYFYEGGTFEGLLNDLSKKQSHESTLILQDEITGLFEGMNQYKGGKGDDRQTLLKAWNGRIYETKTYKSQKPVVLRGQTVSLVGGIQTHLAKKYLNLSNDLDGLACRFLYCQSQIQQSRVTDIAEDIEAFDSIYEKAEALECETDSRGQVIPKAMIFDSNAYRYSAGVESRLNTIGYQQSSSNPVLASYAGKMNQYYFVFCGLLHFIKWCFDPSVDLYTIDIDTVQKAWKVTEFFLGQFILIQGSSEAYKTDSLTGIYKDIIDYCQTGEGTISTRELYRKFPRKIDGQKMNAKIAGEILEHLASQGLGDFKNKTFTYKLTDKDVNLSSDLKANEGKAFEYLTTIAPPTPIDPENRIDSLGVNQSEKQCSTFATLTVLQDNKEEKIGVETQQDVKTLESSDNKDSNDVNTKTFPIVFEDKPECILNAEYNDPSYPELGSNVILDKIVGLCDDVKKEVAQIIYQGKEFFVYVEHLIISETYANNCVKNT